jgi:hypothetical protein
MGERERGSHKLRQVIGMRRRIVRRAADMYKGVHDVSRPARTRFYAVQHCRFAKRDGVRSTPCTNYTDYASWHPLSITSQRSIASIVGDCAVKMEQMKQSTALIILIWPWARPNSSAGRAKVSGKAGKPRTSATHVVYLAATLSWPSFRSLRERSVPSAC